MIGAQHPLELGWQSFQQGDLAHAERVAEHVIEQEANLADGWFLRGLIHHVRGERSQATDFYKRAIELKPDYFGAINNLGVIHADAGRHDEAVATIAKYLHFDPENAVANCNYANSLAALGRAQEAASHYCRALAQHPDFLDALINFGTLLIGQNNPREALPYFQRAYELDPGSFQANNNVGLAYSLLGQYQAAQFHLVQAVGMNPQNTDAQINLGDHFTRVGQFEAAVASYRNAVDLRPDDASANNSLGLALWEQGSRTAALACFHRALELNPALAAAHCNLGKAFTELGRFTEAETHLREALRLKPDYEHPYNLLGMIHFQRGEDDASLACYEEALRRAPNLVHAKLNRAFLRLRQGDFVRAWPDYELRLATGPANDTPCLAPRWDGAELNGQTVLVRTEQGRGDILQFLRYLPLVRAKGGRVVFELQPGLHPLVSRANVCDQLIGKGLPLPPVDWQIPIMSLPAVLGTIDAPTPYLVADPQLVESWSRELKSAKGLKIGIGWQGDPTFRFDRLRSIPLEQFEPIARLTGVTLISLQKHDGVDQIAPNRERVPLLDFGDRLDAGPGSFMDTAAIMKNLDLVITSDTATAHLAGGLGVPTWLAAPLGPDWRWFLEREDSPWYPTMRLFRQTRLGEWGDVFARMAEALRAKLAARESMPTPVAERRLSAALFVPTSPGELLDKFTILQIKSERLTNPSQIHNVRTEMRLLEEQRDRLLAGSASIAEFAAQLKKVNETLWQVEEDLRSCERMEDFGPRFVELARSVYKHNDQRAALKRKINLSLGSSLTEEKTHPLASDR